MIFDYKKSLGQNFLKDNNIINKIVSSIEPDSDDLIVEIGPGSGALTKKLINKKCDIICFEIDKRLESILNEIKSDNLKIVFEDFLKVDLNDYINKKYKNIYFIGNLPYYITTAIINRIVEKYNPFEIVIMIQKEVALRYMSKPCNREYGSISVFLQYNFDIKKVCDVSKNSFEPIPKVDSMVIKLIKKEKVKDIDENKLFKLIHDSFRQKRKNLRNNLKEYDLLKLEDILNKINKSLTNRAEELSLDDFIFISKNI